ncbi:MAG: pyruvate, phosphate dikinase [Firmicutes bacterium]|nr:pyruvate, phosphate dikinase [Bacillota bacterium]
MFNEGDGSMINLLGGKGANLCEMTRLGLPIPQGFIVSTEGCTNYNTSGKVLSSEIKQQIDSAIVNLEKLTGKQFGLSNSDKGAVPLLVSVRSGSRASMPGMMDTILNLGLNDEVVEVLAAVTNNARFAYDSYRRFIMMYGSIVEGIDKHIFESAFDNFKARNNIADDADLTAEHYKKIANMFKESYKYERERDFPTCVKEQLFNAVEAVFDSWENERAYTYRRMYDIPHDWGTAVNVQSMVYGNFCDKSGTGVVFSRNPSTGDKEIYGEYIMNAQGEDIVAGLKTPKPFSELEAELPEVYKEFLTLSDLLERHYKDMQDMEFTIEQGKLYFLQTRSGKRTATAALKIAIDLVDEVLITKQEAVLMVDPKQLDALLHPVFDTKALAKAQHIAKGLAASPGAASGKIYFTSKDAERAAAKGEKVILVRNETSPDDIGGMHVSEGILTAKGGMTSHAAVVARGMGTCCVCGLEALQIDEKGKRFTLGGKVYKEGAVISLDGSTGKVYEGAIATVKPKISGHFATFMEWADNFRKMQVRTNADTPEDAKKAIEFGAEGIGLVRSEHMFFDKERIPKMQRLILAETEKERLIACRDLIGYQRADYIGIFKAMGVRPVTIRLLDPPLHEFLPKTDAEFKLLAKQLNARGRDKVDWKQLKLRAASLHEINPMMGHRGCRLAVSYPEIAAMQTRAIIEALVYLKQNGLKANAEIMIPLINDVKEMRFVKNIVLAEAQKVLDETSIEVDYTVGTMIEIPRAALHSFDIALEADFFSFGTNDLTQLTYGISRDDGAKILQDYLDNNIYPNDPFASLDKSGVGLLMEMSVKEGKRAKPDLKIGICGEHGGDPVSIEYCYKLGLDYVSCSPYRVPIARLAAAQASIREEREKEKGLSEVRG